MTETRDSFKNEFLCKICLKILKQPMKLPCDCGENVCEEHLNKKENLTNQLFYFKYLKSCPFLMVFNVSKIKRMQFSTSSF